MAPLNVPFRRFSNLVRTRLRALGAGLATPLLALVLAWGAPAAAEPALWVVRDHDSTIYLFGTVHLLRESTSWQSPKIADAMAHAQDLTLEIADTDPQPDVVVALIQKYGLDPGRPLSGKLNAAERAKLAKVCAVYGLDPARLDPLRPWVAALQLSLLPIVKAGYDPGAGVDRYLKAQADRRGEPVAGFETLDEQIAYFASLPPDAELSYLRQTLEETGDVVAQLDALEGAWEAGDVEAIAKIMNDDMRASAPGLYDLLLTRRNRAFADRIKAKLAGKGVSFVAIGAAHLAGPDSVQAQLARLGVRTERL